MKNNNHKPEVKRASNSSSLVKEKVQLKEGSNPSLSSGSPSGELKTLNDIWKHGNWGLSRENDFKELKAEAIKWVKEDIKDFEIDLEGEPTIDSQLTIGWMKRLNISEEDLK